MRNTTTVLTFFLLSAATALAQGDVPSTSRVCNSPTDVFCVPAITSLGNLNVPNGGTFGGTVAVGTTCPAGVPPNSLCVAGKIYVNGLEVVTSPVYTYFVSPNGSDGNTGKTPTQAFQTLAQAESTAANGDTIGVMSGTYSEDVICLKGLAWTALGAVKWQANSGTQAITIGGNSTASWDGFTFDGKARANTVLIAATAAGSKTLKNGAIQNATARLVSTVAGGTGTLALISNTLSAVSTSGPAIDISSGAFALDVEANTITVSSTSQAKNIVNIMDQATPIVKNNTIEQYGTQSNIWIGSTGTAVGVATITGNVLKAHNIGTFWMVVIGADNDPGVVAYNKLDGSIVQGNTIYGPLYYSPTETTVITHAVLYAYNLNGLLSKNNLYGVGYGFVLKHTAGTAWTSGGVFYNLIKNTAPQATLPAIYCKGQSGVRIYHNTVLQTVGPSPFWTAIESQANTSAAQNNDVRNNLIVSQSDSVFYYQIWYDNPNTSDYNLYWTTGVLGGFGYSGTRRATWTDWNTAGYDLHGINADPKINADGTLQPGSPAIGAGVFIPGVSTSATPNIGAK